MTTEQIKASITNQAWPAQDLESVAACPVCGSNKRRKLHTNITDRVFFCAPGAWTLYRCRKCRSAYLDPRPTSTSIGRAYSRYYTHAQSAVRDRSSQLRLGRLRLALRNGYLNARFGYEFQPSLAVGAPLAWLFPWQRMKEDRAVRHLRRPADNPRLLDVGCGNGAFLDKMRAAGWSVEGLDPDPSAVAAAAEIGLTVHPGTIEAADLPENSFDAITLNHVIEHLHDPIAALQACYRALRPGGVVWLATPNLNARGHRVFHTSWLGLDTPRHLVLFTPAALSLALKRTGFTVGRRQYFSPSAEWMYRVSNAIALGKDPFGAVEDLSGSLRRKARLADLLAWLRPTAAEELVLVGHKPLESRP